MGRFLGRIHLIGKRQRFRHRGRIEIERLGHEPRDYLLAHDWIPPHLQTAYESLTADLLNEIHAAFDAGTGVAEVRLHGDCHRGNVLWTDTGPHFVDLDDCLMGPPVQDLWMLLSGLASRDERATRRTCSKATRSFATFDARELVLVESLRTLRMIHYSAWLARR
jgi:Ser/Thr protein kinase RdoA (MazF antagonist)